MKKTLRLLTLLAGIFALGVARAYAIPVVDGTNTGTEWVNNGTYSYYLEINDPNEPLVPDNYDISHVVLLQSITGAPTDGVYLLIEVYGGDASLVDFDSPTVLPPFAAVNMSGDFDGNGTNDIFVTHSGGNTAGTAQTVLVANPTGFPVPPVIPFPGIPISSCNGFGGCGSFAEGTVLEYFLPTGLFGTPAHVPFPLSFIGTIVYDNGGTPPDDVTVGSLVAVPEPGTIFLLGSGLLSLLGLGKFRKS